MRGTLELIITEHALERLNDLSRFSAYPEVAVNDEVRLHHLRRVDSKEAVWMCQVQGGFLVGNFQKTKRRQMLIAMTAWGKNMVRKTFYIRIACHRLVVERITWQSGGKQRRVSTLKECI